MNPSVSREPYSYSLAASRKMNKKKSNGFIFFADSRRPYYENEAGRKLGHRGLVERAAVDWDRMNESEQEMWKKASKKRQDTQVQMLVPKKPQPLTQPKPKARVVSQLEKELIERAKVKGIDRETAKQQLMDKLLWKNEGDVSSIVDRAWCLAVLSEASAPDGTPLEVVFTTTNKGATKAEMRLRIVGAKVIEKEGVRDVFWNHYDSNDVNAVALQMSKFISGGWNSLVLVPSHQAKRLGLLMQNMKKTRDQLTGRDTTSIRLDRLMCMEDVLTVFRKVSSRPEVDSDDDIQWEQLREMHMDDTVFFARATSEHFLSCMAKCRTEPLSEPVTECCFNANNELPKEQSNRYGGPGIVGGRDADTWNPSSIAQQQPATANFLPKPLNFIDYQQNQYGQYLNLAPPPGIPLPPSVIPAKYRDVQEPEAQKMQPSSSAQKPQLSKTVLRADAPVFTPAAHRIDHYELYHTSFLNFAKSVESQCSLNMLNEIPSRLSILDSSRVEIDTQGTAEADFIEQKYDQPQDFGLPPGISAPTYGRPNALMRNGFRQKSRRRQGRSLAQTMEPQGGFRNAHTIDTKGEATSDQMSLVSRWLNSLSMQELKALDSEYEHLREEDPDEDEDFEEDCFPNAVYCEGDVRDECF